RNVQIDPSLNLEELAKVAHSLGEVVGLGLRNPAHCPVELNLMPKSSLKPQHFNQKKPYLVASVFCLILVVFTYGWFYSKVAQRKNEALTKLEQQAQPLKNNEQTLNKRLLPEIRGLDIELGQFTNWVEDRFYWANVLSQLRQILLEVEGSQETALKAKTGIWIEKLVPITSATPVAPVFTPTGFSPELARHLSGPGSSSPGPSPRKLRGINPPGASPPGASPPAPGTPGATSGQAAPPTEIIGVILTCRSMNM